VVRKVTIASGCRQISQLIHCWGLEGYMRTGAGVVWSGEGRGERGYQLESSQPAENDDDRAA
jgi:hypothetical protein